MEVYQEIEIYSDTIYKILCENVGNEDVVSFNRTSLEFLSKKLILPKQRLDGVDTKRWMKGLLKEVVDKLPPQLGKYFEQVEKEVLNAHPELLRSMFTSIQKAQKSNVYILSGSRAEGFDLQSSDYDIMIDLKFFKAVQNPRGNEENEYNISCLRIETNFTKPGFVRLESMVPVPSFQGDIFFIRKNDKHYLSNKAFGLFATNVSKLSGNETVIHGPCQSTPSQNLDLAYFVPSDTWPQAAGGCIKRMLKNNWPPYDTVRDMIKDGCLFVPIGCKSSPSEEIEWRMSFSLAEKRLVHSMNHTQFLTYALLKLFLREVVENNIILKGLLCSYFMKTLVFWEIMETKITWTPTYLVQHFWNCFRRLLGWIDKEYCPNFFLPENNMFIGKIHGENKRNLLKELGSLYRQGYLILQNIPVIRHELERWRFEPQRSVSCGVRRSKIIEKLLLVFYVELPYDISSPAIYKILSSSRSVFLSDFCDFLRLSQLNIKCYKELSVEYNKVSCNRIKYRIEKAITRVTRATSPDSIRGKLFLAMFFYKTRQYEKCISILQKAILKLQDKELIFTWIFDAEKFASLGGDVLSLQSGMYRYTTSFVPVDVETCVPEILEECMTPGDVYDGNLIHPVLLANFILFLCHFRKGDYPLARVFLLNVRHFSKESEGQWQNTEAYLLRGKPMLSRYTKALSLEILGISQNIMGDYQDALHSFEEIKLLLIPGMEIAPFHEHFLDVNKQRISNIKSLLNILKTDTLDLKKKNNWFSRTFICIVDIFEYLG